MIGGILPGRECSGSRGFLRNTHERAREGPDHTVQARMDRTFRRQARAEAVTQTLKLVFIRIIGRCNPGSNCYN